MESYEEEIKTIEQENHQVSLQNRRNGFIEQYIYTEEQLEEIKLQ